jgi:bleomycin hydrolase
MRVVALLIAFAGFIAFAGVAQENEVFIIEKEIKHLPVISQGSTGTCWSFATTSFLESEIIRKGFPATDLSEMFFVYHAYEDKTEQFLLYHGHNNFGEGGQAHDVMNVLRDEGMATFNDFPGEKENDRYSHRSLVNELESVVEELNRKRNEFDASDISEIEPALKKYIGKLPKKMKTEEGRITPSEFPGKVEINPDDYIEISSYTHHPFYQPFVLEVPDNWAHGLYYNLPIDELMEVIDFSLDNGYSVCWDGDTSEKTFTHKKGKADLPKEQIGKVDQELRQETFLNRTTTDDHLMHIIGLSKDAEGRKCYYTKNSWGAKSNDYGGYLHMTQDYVRLKTIAILVHKDAVPVNIKEKLKL